MLSMYLGNISALKFLLMLFFLELRPYAELEKEHKEEMY